MNFHTLSHVSSSSMYPVVRGNVLVLVVDKASELDECWVLLLLSLILVNQLGYFGSPHLTEEVTGRTCQWLVWGAPMIR